MLPAKKESSKIHFRRDGASDLLRTWRSEEDRRKIPRFFRFCRRTAPENNREPNPRLLASPDVVTQRNVDPGHYSSDNIIDEPPKYHKFGNTSWTKTDRSHGQPLLRSTGRSRNAGRSATFAVVREVRVSTRIHRLFTVIVIRRACWLTCAEALNKAGESIAEKDLNSCHR